MTAVGSCMTNKYSEGRPGARYYGGNEHIDQCELLCEKRALELYQLDPNEWGVNVQTLSGSPANFAVYTGLLQPYDRIMGLDLPHGARSKSVTSHSIVISRIGGHLTHGFMTAKRRVSATSVYFASMPYRLDESTGLIDYDTLEKNAKLFRPKIIIAGASAYSRDFDYARFRKICDSVEAYLMVDMAHVSGLIASELLASPFPYADVVTTTTHKSLRGPRGSMVFYRLPYKQQIDQAVFPGLQGGPHNHTIAGIAVALKMASAPEFKAYSTQVVSNCQAMAEKLKSYGYDIISGGTDNHLILVDLKAKGIDGSRVQHTLDLVKITLNKNSVPGDKSAMNPGGVRIGTPAMTTRGCDVEAFEKIADFIHRAVEITIELKKTTPGAGKVADFVKHASEVAESHEGIQQLRTDVIAFASSYPMPGL